MYNTYKDVLEDTCFRIPSQGMYIGDNFQELPFLWIWQALKAYYQDQQTVEAPSKSMLAHYIREIFRSGVFVDEDLRRRILDEPSPTEGYLAFIYDDVELNHRTGVPLVKSFLEERVIQYGLSRITTFAEVEQKPLSQQLSDLTETARRIDTAGYTYAAAPLMPGADHFSTLPQEQPLLSTGVTWIDRSLGGGQREGQCYAIMGATGAGKTTLGIQLAVRGAEVEYAAAMREGRKPNLTLYYSFEEPYSSLFSRFVSCGARIARTRFEYAASSDRGLIRPVSTCMENSYEYERRRWSHLTQFESERMDDFSRIANGSLYVRNFSGVPDIGDTPELAELKRKIGLGGVTEIMMDAKRLSDQLQTGIRSIFIDYVGLVCMRQAEYDNDRYYGLLRSVGDEIRMMLAGRLSCTVWVLHQLSGVANGASPLRKPTLADGEGCKSLPVNMHACWLLGVPDRSNPRRCGGARSWFVTAKMRCSGGNDGDDGLIVQQDGDFAQLNDVTNLFRPNPRSRGFERRGSEAVLL